MIFLTLLYLFFSRPWNTFALPTTLQSDFIHDVSHLGTRTIYDILWSCLSTIFTCTWIVVHPNIPAPRDSQWAVLRRRMVIMAYILIAPEFVIIWAGRQHFAACYYAKKHKENHPGWSRSHAFFLIMGGFTLHEGGKPVRVLEATELEELSEAGMIEWPTITEDEIADRSKGDYLSKTIVLFQTTWFVVQCIARGAYGLDVTELEVVTLAFATLTGVIYYFWWDKPLDVRCSIPVHLLKGRLEKIQNNVKKEDTGSRIIFPDQGKEEDEEGATLPNPLPSFPIQGGTSTPDPGFISVQVKEGDKNLKKGAIFPNPLPSFPVQGGTSTPDPESISVQVKEGDEKGTILPNPLPSCQAQGSTSTLDPVLTRMQQFQNFRRQACTKHGTVFGLVYIFIVFPLIRFFQAFDDMLGPDETLGDNILRVPTFYSSPNDDGGNAIVLGVCVAIVFGAIHCIAWSFHFVTLPEQWAWRISAIFVLVLPITIVLISGLPTIFDKKEHKTIGMKLYKDILECILMSIACLYIVARIALLVLPFVALRVLVPGAHVQVDWISFLPHI